MSRAEENGIDIFDEDYLDYEDNFEKGYWKGTKIKDMDEGYLLNAIRYAVNHPPISAIDCDDWNNKIKELLDEFCDRVEKSDLRTDFDLLG